MIIHKLAAVAVALSLTGCLNPSQEAAVQSAIAANKVRILNACMTDILPYTRGLPGQAVSVLVPAAAQAVADVNAACDPSNIDVVSQSASTLAWFAAQKIVISTNAAVRPATIAPQPITSAS